MGRTLAAGLAVVVLWASAFAAIRVAAPELGVIELSVVRLVVASLALLAIAPVVGTRCPRRRDLPRIIACGATGMTSYQLLLNWGERSVPAGTASIVVAAAPLVSVLIAASAFGERLTAVKITGSAIAISGVALVSGTGVSLSGASCLVIGAAIVQGVYHPLTKPLLAHYTGLEVATYAMVAGTILTLPFAPWGLHRASGGAWLAALYLGLLPSALGFVLWGYVVRRLPMATSTSLLYLVPAVAVLIAYIWLGEIPTAGELLGGAVVVFGVITIGQGDRFARQFHRGRAADPPRTNRVPSAARCRETPPPTTETLPSLRS